MYNDSTYAGERVWEVEVILAIIVGVCLSATCGFRVFTPLLVTSVLLHFEWVTLSEGFSWIGSTPALIAFFVATLCEVFANYLPFISAILKTIAIPAATIAGTLLMAAYIGEMNDFVKWAIAIIAGGGTAGTVNAALIPIKASSELIPVVGPASVSFVEDIIAFFASLFAFLLPILAIILLAVILIVVIKVFRKYRLPRKKLTG